MEKEEDRPTPQQCSGTGICQELQEYFIFSTRENNESIIFNKVAKNSFNDQANAYYNNIQKHLISLEPALAKNYLAAKSYLQTQLVLQQCIEQNPLSEIPSAIQNYMAQTMTKVLQDLDQRINAIIKWNKQSFTPSRWNPNPTIFFGFSLIDQLQAKGMGNRFKTFTMEKIGLARQPNRFFYMVNTFENIFTNLNHCISWYYQLQKTISKEGLDKPIFKIDNKESTIHNCFKKIHKELTMIRDSLQNYQNVIQSNVIHVANKSAQEKLQGEIEVAIATCFINTINANATIIESLLPQKTKKEKKVQPLPCVCPFLQTKISFNDLQAIQDIDDQATEQYKTYFTKLAAHVVKRPNPITYRELSLTRQVIDRLLPHTITQEMIIVDPSIKTPANLAAQINIITEKVTRWSKQLIQNPNVWQKFKNWRTGKDYFFGFSLIQGPRQGMLKRKSRTYNRYTYMVDTFENIFKELNTLRAQNQDMSSCGQALQNLVNAFEVYKNHFFASGDLIRLLPLTKPNNLEMLTITASNNNNYALQVGIEYCIADRFIAWIENNINILKNPSLQEKTEPFIEEISEKEVIFNEENTISSTQINQPTIEDPDNTPPLKKRAKAPRKKSSSSTSQEELLTELPLFEEEKELKYNYHPFTESKGDTFSSSSSSDIE